MRWNFTTKASKSKGEVKNTHMESEQKKYLKGEMGKLKVKGLKERSLA